MKKKLISTVLAAVMAISAVSALNTNAIYNWGTTDSEAFEGLIKVEEKYEYLEHNFYNKDKVLAVYMEHNPENNSFYFRCIDSEKDCIKFSVSKLDDISRFEEKLAEIDEQLHFNYNQNKKTNIYNCNITSSEMSPDTVKKLREAIGNAAENFEFRNNVLSYYTICSNHLPEYTPSSGSNEIENFKETAEAFKSFIAENNINAKVVHYDKYTQIEDGSFVEANTIRVIPTEEITPIEYLELANTMYLGTGINPDSIIPEDTGNEMQGGITLDLTDYLNGDANCDQKYSIADSTAILQALGNPDKYGLSDLGLFNADSTGDGLTVEDAVAIKTALAKGIE